MWIRDETHRRRPDLIIFINGFHMVFIELKNSNILVKNAYDINLKNYLKDIPYLFNYNQICVLSNGMETRLGSCAVGYEFFFGEVRQKIFNGFTKACHTLYKIDSNTERIFAIVLENDKDVQKWMRPSPKPFNIYYGPGDMSKYKPDFIVETCILVPDTLNFLAK